MVGFFTLLVGLKRHYLQDESVSVRHHRWIKKRSDFRKLVKFYFWVFYEVNYWVARALWSCETPASWSFLNIVAPFLSESASDRQRLASYLAPFCRLAHIFWIELLFWNCDSLLTALVVFLKKLHFFVPSYRLLKIRYTKSCSDHEQVKKYAGFFD